MRHRATARQSEVESLAEQAARRLPGHGESDIQEKLRQNWEASEAVLVGKASLRCLRHTSQITIHRHAQGRVLLIRVL